MEIGVNTFAPGNLFNSQDDWIEFVDNVNYAYDQIGCYRKNLFNVPSGTVGKEFVKELTFWLSQLNSAGSNLNSIALKCFMILPALILQKPHAKSKTREHVICMKRRLDLWKCVNGAGFLDLFAEVEAIQKKLKSRPKQRREIDVNKTFASLIMQGKISSAMKILDKDIQSGVLQMSPEVANELQEKHPAANPVAPGSLLFGPKLNCQVASSVILMNNLFNEQHF